MVQDIISKADCHSAYQKSPALFLEPKGSLPSSQNTDIGSYVEQLQSSPHIFTQFNVVLPLTRRCPY